MPLPTIAGDIPLDQAGSLGGPTPAAAAPTDFFDRAKLAWKQSGAAANWGSNDVNWRNSAISEINDGLRKKGIEPVADLMDYDDMERRLPMQRGESSDQYQDRAFRTVLDQVAKARAADPTLLPDFVPVVDRKSFDQLIATRRNNVLKDVATRAPDGLGVAGLIGGIAHGAVDPISYIPVGGPEAEAASIGGRILKQVFTGAAVNAGVTTVTEPLVRIDAARIGQQRTAGDFFTDLMTSAATGGILMGGIEGLRVGRDKVAEVLQRRAAEPPATGTPFDSFDAKVASTFAEIVPEDQRTPDEQAAIHAIQRDAEVKATSPFVPGPAGDDAHAQSLDRAMSAIHNPDQLPQRGAAKPIARESIAGSADVEGTRFPDRELVKAKIHSVEAPHGGPNLAGGAAYGPYQFEPRTWVNLFKRRYPNDKRGFDEIAGLRGDAHLNDVLMNDLISENAAALRHAGFGETAGNLYLAHVLGHDRAVRVLSADPNARLGDILPESYFKNNPFRPNDTSASLVHWAYGKMGDKSGLPVHMAEAPDAAQGAEAISAGEGDPQVVQSTGRFDVEALYGDVGMTDRPVLNPDHFASPEDHAVAQLRFERAGDAADGFAPVMSRDEAFAPAEHFDAIRRYQGTVTAEAIGEALGLTPGEVRRVVGSMQSTDPKSPLMLTKGRAPKYDAQGNVTREGTEAGRVIRRPKVPATTETLLDFLSKNGGLNDHGGDLAAKDAQLWHKAAPFRRKLIDKDHGMAIDDAFQSAIDAGYFPEHSGNADTYDKLPDTADFLHAIDEELRGKPRFATADLNDVLDRRDALRMSEEDHHPVEPEQPERMTAEAIAAEGIEPEQLAAWHNMARDRGVELSDAEAIEAYHRFYDGPAKTVDEAIGDTLMEAASRELQEYAAMTGDLSYEDASHEWETYVGEHPEIRGDGEPGGSDAAGDRRSTPAEGGEGASREALAAAAHDPEAGRFSDPVGDAAEVQADSAIHDLQMEAKATVKPNEDYAAATYFYDGGSRQRVHGLGEEAPAWVPKDGDVALGAFNDGLPRGRSAVEVRNIKFHGEDLTWLGVVRPSVDAAFGDRQNVARVGVWLRNAVTTDAAPLLEALDRLSRWVSDPANAAKVRTSEFLQSEVERMLQDRAAGFARREHPLAPSNPLLPERTTIETRHLDDVAAELTKTGATSRALTVFEIDGAGKRQEAPAKPHSPDEPAVPHRSTPEQPTYRLDDEGGETDLQSILDEIDEAQKAVAEMRDCLKPKGGGE